MQTLYIDVYFLINFTVDFLSLYFSVRMAKLPTSLTRLLLGGVIGAVAAVLNAIISSFWLGYASLFISFVLMIWVSSKKVSLYRRIKLAFCFSVTEMLMGGMVYWLYNFLNRHLNNLSTENLGGAQNRSLLVLSVIVLLSIGVFKLLISVFSFSSGSETVEVKIIMKEKEVCGEALVDTGNLAKDPMGSRSVMLINSKIAANIFDCGVEDVDTLPDINTALKSRVRLIPVTFGSVRKLLIAFCPDSVQVKIKNTYQNIDVVIAVDKEGGEYGGTNILMPSAAICDVVKKSH